MRVGEGPGAPDAFDVASKGGRAVERTVTAKLEIEEEEAQRAPGNEDRATLLRRPQALLDLSHGASSSHDRNRRRARRIRVTDLLDRLLRALAPLPRGRIETSVRFGPQTRDDARATVWVPVRDLDLTLFAPALAVMDAPPAARAALATMGPRRKRVGFAVGGGVPRLYLDDVDPRTSATRATGLRWDPDVRTATYRFQFTSGPGPDPVPLVHPDLRGAARALLEHPDSRRLGGVWIREDRDGCSQVDVALPWQPAGKDLPAALGAALDALGHDDPLRRWPALRHVAFGVRSPTVTLYASAPSPSDWPATLDALRAAVHAGARREAKRLASQVLAPIPRSAHSSRARTTRFYDPPDLAAWRAVLGDALHYHGGLFADPPDLSDAGVRDAMESSVRALLPFIPPAARVYDIGCGWGGPLAILAEAGHDVLGLTPSPSQAAHVAALGLPVRLGTVEETLPPGPFDVALLLESLSHVRDKARLLRTLRPFCSRLVLRVNVQDGRPPGEAFGGTMHMVSSTRLRTTLEAAGWRVVRWCDRRPEALPSVRAWADRLANIPRTDDVHLEQLRRWTGEVLSAPHRWAAANPLLEIVADRA